MRLKWFVKAGLLVATMAILGGIWGWKYYVEHRYDDLIRYAAGRYQMEPALVKAVVWRESRFYAGARGKAGEIGLMQVGTVAAHEWASAEGVPAFQHEQCFNPLTNILAGTWYLHKALSKYDGADNPIPYALAEYNAGRRNVLKWRTGAARTNGVQFVEQISFLSTSNYVRDIMQRHLKYRPQFRQT